MSMACYRSRGDAPDVSRRPVIISVIDVSEPAGDPEQLKEPTLTHFAYVARPARYWINDALGPRTTERRELEIGVLPVLQVKGDRLRVVVEDERARVGVWIERKHVRDVALAHIQLADEAGRAPIGTGVWLKAGAIVTTLRKQNRRVAVQLVEDVEATGWIPQDHIGKVWAADEGGTAPTMLLAAKTTITSAMNRAAVIATSKNEVPVRIVRTIGAWSEVEIEGRSVIVKGFVASNRLRARPGELGTADGTWDAPFHVPAGTCVYGGPGGQIIGVTLRKIYNVYPEVMGWAVIRINSPLGQIEGRVHFRQGNIYRASASDWETCPRR
jgi:hypothetical protein